VIYFTLSMTRIEQDFYRTLCLDSSAVAADIRKAYRQAALHAHPDKGGSSEMFHAISQAFDVLSCPIARRAYDDRWKSFGRKLVVMRTKKRQASFSQMQEKRPLKRRCRSNGRCLSRKSVDFKPQAHIALESLRHALQEMPHRQRLAAVSKMDKRITAALTAFMKKGDAKPHSDGCMSVTAENSLGSTFDSRAIKPSRGVWILRGSGVCRYKARVNFNCLCLYGRWQSDLDTAIEHQMALTRVRNAVMTELAHDSGRYMTPTRVSEICRLILAESQVEESKLGLAAYVSMRAYGCRMDSPALSLEQAWSLQAKLMEARKASWEHFREMWIVLLCKGRKRMSASAAKVYVEKARESGLRMRYDQAMKRFGKAFRFG
jgi:curved DNA-binding protein CbpA